MKNIGLVRVLADGAVATTGLASRENCGDFRIREELLIIHPDCLHAMTAFAGWAVGLIRPSCRLGAGSYAGDRFGRVLGVLC